MGKDGDHKGSGQNKMTKDEIKQEHVTVVQREKELAEQYDEIKAVFQKLEEGYQSSKGTFSVQRYGQLKDMIKAATSEATINNIKSIINPPTSTATKGKGGLSGLVQRATEFSSHGQQQAAESSNSQATGQAKPPGKMSGLMKKIKKATGFSDDPVTDEDVMTESQLQRDTARKQRSTQLHINQLKRAVTKLETLGLSYQASKSHAPPKRYQELKDMIKLAVADKFT